MKITDLEPKLVWQCFDEITKVPRPTHHLEKMKQFLVDWANRHNIPVKTDEVGNVMMSKPATKGHENAPTIILQGHQDMVAEKRGDKVHDFLNDPITTIVDGDWVKADGTTLGADNGMGCATAMAVLLDDNLVHGPIECLFTVDEEQGLIGANGLQAGFVTGSILLNLDSEEHGQLVIGCAGGKVTTATMKYSRKDAGDRKFYKVHLNHFKGGHSGMEIGLGRGNANQQLCRFLWEANHKYDFELAAIDGGGLANAIPREAWAVVGVKESDKDCFENCVKKFSDMLHAEFLLAEGENFTFDAVEVEKPATVMDNADAHKLVSVVFSCPNAVQGMSNAVEGLIETSCNLASVKMEGEDTIVVTIHQRSSVDSRRDEIADKVKALFELVGCKVEFDDCYVGWAPNPNSKVLKVAEESFKDLFGKAPRVEALHAGLECGLFLEKMPDLDMISFGPTLKDIHSPSEKANIPSVGEYWKLLCEILKRLA